MLYNILSRQTMKINYKHYIFTVIKLCNITSALREVIFTKWKKKYHKVSHSRKLILAKEILK